LLAISVAAAVVAAPLHAADEAPTLRRVFVTSVAGNGDLDSWDLPVGVPPIPPGFDGLAAGDYICAALALRAGLAEAFSYRAWLSDSVDDAFCRLLGLNGKKVDDCGETELDPNAGPWARVDGLAFAPSLVAITSGTPSLALSPARLDENGNAVVGEPREAWTGTTTTGEASVDGCQDWTTSSNDLRGASGSAVKTVDNWTFEATPSCAAARRLLCMQQGSGPPPVSPVRGGRFAFVTSVGGTGDLSSWPDAGGQVGIAAGDAICRARAAAGGLYFPDSFKAWLSDDDTDAKDRFSSGAWIRLDGFLLASSIASLTDGALGTAIDRDELGQPVTLPLVWTGTLPTGLFSLNNCLDWSNDSGAAGTKGEPNNASGEWTADSTLFCDAVRRLYCFSDAPPSLLFADGFESASFHLWSGGLAAASTP
jgi:hypothetical protein